MRATTVFSLVMIGAACIAAPLIAEEAPPAATPSPASPAPASTTPPVEPPSVQVLGSRQVQSILGREVRSATGDDMGRIVDVLVDHSGQVRAAIIDFGGFLGVGSRKSAVDWNALRFSPNSDHRDTVMLELSRDQVKAAPEYKDKQAVIVLGVAGALQQLPE